MPSVETLYQKDISSFVMYIFIISQEGTHVHFLILKFLSLYITSSEIFFVSLKFCSSFIFFVKLCVLSPTHSQGGLTRFSSLCFHYLYYSTYKNMFQISLTNLESIWVGDLLEDRYPFLFCFTSNLHSTKNFWVSAQQLFLNEWIYE